MEHNLIKNAIANGKTKKKTNLEYIQNRLAGISKALYDKTPKVCPFSTNNCPLKSLKQTHFIQSPFPSVLLMNINWFNNQVPYMDTLLFCASIPQ